ncbi:Uroporphyrinogen-III C-methyltransferase [Bremerella volcania]|uniref:uroporphyrinogen-III C-methyltransferase n=1 Tax=Bremerella volcania TaxID=2527984 RepID=A0A518C6J0_9BACT|nr:uroporphyrinogen-III C-methyltransferase [Bremerella volcania]QDU74834.1 Uroporphyrinogen-III C-methyltransferase [Bremerella volcania]
MTPTDQDSADAGTGTVYLVGSGPGDAGLITQRGIQCLRQADVVLYDYLSNPELLEYAISADEMHCLGSHAQRKLWSQDRINEEMIAQAKQGKKVVRLKSGDPTVFARATEEIEALRAADVPFQIVPGITTALAASAYAGIPLTHSDYASAVAFVTGHEKPGKDGSAIDFASLASFPGTLVFYMGVTTAPQWSAQLIAHGKSADTPCAIIRRCSWPDQETFRCTLGEIPNLLHSGSKIRPPVITVVGEVAQDQSIPNWFEERALFGQSFLITRPEHQASELRLPLAELGAEVFVQPAIDINFASDQAPLNDAIANLKSFDWIAFSSRNGVVFFMERLRALGFDFRLLGHLKIGAIGPGTAEQLHYYGFKADVIPDEYRAESLVAAMADQVAGKRVLLPRASRGRDVLPAGLTQHGADVTEVIAYQSTDVTQVSPEVQRQMESTGFDWVIVTSSAIARATAQLVPEVMKSSNIVSISPITSDTIRQLGYEVTVEAKVYTMDGIVEAILAYEDENSV